MNSVFLALLKRDLLLVYRNPGSYTTPIIFFLVCSTLFSFSAGTDIELLTTIGPGVIWVAALLSAILSLDGIFRSDFEDGTLDQLMVSPAPLSLLVLAKILAHWISTGLPLLVASPILGILMNLDFTSTAVLSLTLAISTPVFSLVGAFGASLVVTQKKAGMLLSLITLPLCIPVLLYSVSAVLAVMSERAITGHLSLLLAFFVFALSVSPFATAATLRLMAGDS